MMEDLLAELEIQIPASLQYLKTVNVLDDENLPNDAAGYPQIGLLDGGAIYKSFKGLQSKDLGDFVVSAVAYQEISGDKPGAAVMGSAEQLGASGKGVLAIARDLRTFLNDNFLGLGVGFAHVEREEAAATIVNAQDGRMVVKKRLTILYKKFE